MNIGSTRQGSVAGYSKAPARSVAERSYRPPYHRTETAIPNFGEASQEDEDKAVLRLPWDGTVVPNP